MDDGGLRQRVDRLARRLAELAPAQLASVVDADTGETVADLAHRLAQDMADAVAVVEGRASRIVPRLADRAVGDQVAVTGHDLCEALDRLGVPAPDHVIAGIRDLARLL